MSISTDSLMSSRPGSARDRSLVGKLQADWRSMFYHEESKDVSITIAGDQTIRIHSLVLMARCTGKLTNKVCYGDRINCKHLEPSAVKKILLYLYSAELEVIEATDVVPLLIATHEFGLNSLRSYFIQCLDYLLTQINVGKVLNTAHLSLSSITSSDELHQDLWCIIDSCVHFITRNAKTIMLSDIVKDFDRETMKVVVSSKLPLSNQEMLRSILRWGRLKAGTTKLLQSDWTEDERKIVRGYIEEVIPHVQLSDGRPLSPDSITDGVYGILERCSWAEQCVGGARLSSSSATEDSLVDSMILQQRQLQSCTPIINDWCGTNRRWSLLYRGSSHGFAAKQFHAQCDNNGPTLTIILSTNGYVFGGYTDANWNSRNRRGKYSPSQYSFLFSLYNSTSTGPVKYSIRQPSYAINSHPNFGPIFGSGADLSISNNCNDNCDSYSRFPSSYGDDHAHPNSLTGNVYFQVKDYEVFGLN